MYINIHEHTPYSNGRLKDAISKVEDLIDYNHELGLLGTCITEHETISSAIQAQKYFFKKKKEAGWDRDKLLLGNEIYLCPDGTGADNQLKAYPHFVIVALDAIGHRQIRELSTRAWERSFHGRGMLRVPTYYSDLFEVIGANPGHVIGSTACLGGSLPTQILKILDEPDKKEQILNDCQSWISIMHDLFGKNKFFLELQPSPYDEQRYVNIVLLELSEKTGVQYIITTDVHYIKKEDAPIHKIFIESQEGERETDKFYATTYCMGEKEIHEYMDSNIGYDAVEKGISNTVSIYDLAEEYDLQRELKIPYMPINSKEPDEILYQKYKKKVPLFQYYHDSTCDADRHLLQRLMVFMERDEYSRTDIGYEKIQECLEYLKISSEKMNKPWSAYLLSVADYVELCWKAGSLVGPGRGSGVGFRLLYMLGITQIDPIRESTVTYPWRFLNPERASVLDIDIDINPIKKDAIIELLKENYVNVCKVATFSTEKSRSAIQSAARGLGYNDDYAQYVGSLIVSDRGILRTLSQMYYGDEDCKPDINFVNEMNEHPDLWEAALKIEGLIKGVGSHAGGVIISDEPFVESTALMKTSSGDLVTQFDLHTLEDVGLIKIDLLATEFITKAQTTLELLLKDGLIEWQGSLKDTYEKYLGVYILERDDLNMWKMLWDRKVYSFFQMEQDSGIQAVALTKPKSVDDLAVINSVMRLMAQDKGQETPLEKYARFKEDVTLWYQEMDDAGLSLEEQELLKPILGLSYGICESQEKLMILPQIPEIGGFSLAWSDKLRKSVAKKNPQDFAKLEVEFFENAKEKNLSPNLTRYVWYTLIYTQRGYGFNASHTLAYSICGLICLYLCWKYPVIYWNTACLIVDSGSLEETEDNKGTNTGKMAIAIANMQKSGINIALPLINEADFGFKPDTQNNRIVYSLKAISGVGDDVARSIIRNRDFSSMEDFYSRMVDTRIVTPSSMIALIKAGCFSSLDSPDRTKTMKQYIERNLYKRVEKLTLVHLNKMLESQLIKDSVIKDLMRIPAFMRYVFSGHVVEVVVTTDSKRKLPKCGYFDRIFVLDAISQCFFKDHFSEDSIMGVRGEYYLISEKKFTKECNQKKEQLFSLLNTKEILEQYNEQQIQNIYDSVADGSESKWEMDSLSYYYSDHELANINYNEYGIEDFFSMPEDPVPYDYYPRYIQGKKKWFPKNTIMRIAGTVIDRNNDRHTISLLTPWGVVNVKFNKNQYVFYNKTISEVDAATGKKHVAEASWFKKGTKLLICGYRNEFNFRAYRYSDTIYTHVVSKVEKVNQDGTLMLRIERAMD